LPLGLPVLERQVCDAVIGTVFWCVGIAVGAKGKLVRSEDERAGRVFPIECPVPETILWNAQLADSICWLQDNGDFIICFCPKVHLERKNKAESNASYGSAPS
jgi:hypothetical protein